MRKAMLSTTILLLTTSCATVAKGPSKAEIARQNAIKDAMATYGYTEKCEAVTPKARAVLTREGFELDGPQMSGMSSSVSFSFGSKGVETSSDSKTGDTLTTVWVDQDGIPVRYVGECVDREDRKTELSLMREARVRGGKPPERQRDLLLEFEVLKKVSPDDAKAIEAVADEAAADVAAQDSAT